MYKRFLNDYFIHFINFYDWIKYNFCILVLGIGYFWIWSTKSYYMLGLFCTRKFRQHYLAFHFIFIILYRFSCPFSIARFYSYFTYIFFFFVTIFPFYRSATSLHGIVASPQKRRKIDGTTNWFCQSYRGDSHVDGLMSTWKDGRTLKRRSMGHVDRKDPLREYNVPGEQLSLQLHAFFASFIRFFIFFFFLYFSTRFIIGFSIFFFLKTRFVAVLVHSIWTCLDTWSPWYWNQRLRTKREIFFTHWNVKSKNDRSSKNSYTFLLQFSFTSKNTM